MSLADCKRVARVAQAAAEDDFQGKRFAVVVIVQQLDEGKPINVVTNITSGKPDVLELMKSASDGVRGPLIV